MISVLGAGAFGTALAVTLARTGRPVTLWARAPGDMNTQRENRARLPGANFPDGLTVTGDLQHACRADTLLLAVPMQSLTSLLDTCPPLRGKTLVACCKGIDLKRLCGPTQLLSELCPDAHSAILTGPSFAADLARGQPTALTLASTSAHAQALQAQLSTPALRLYLSADPIGADLGGALKNVIALACGAVIGAGLGESARAATMTRGFTEMTRLALHLGSQPETLTGLSGFGDLVLTCTSTQSRNFSTGIALGQGKTLPDGVTVEGMSTARAVAHLAQNAHLDLPISQGVAALVDGQLTVDAVLKTLMARPLKVER